MSPPTDHRFYPTTHDRPLETARALRLEPKPPYGVAADPAVSDTHSESDNADRVEHERKARLARWQAVDPRELKQR